MAQRNAGRRTFTMQEAAYIRQCYLKGESQGSLARKYRVTLNTIGRLVRGETYIEASRTQLEQPHSEDVVSGQLDYHDEEKMEEQTERWYRTSIEADRRDGKPTIVYNRNGTVLGEVTRHTTDADIDEWMRIRAATPAPQKKSAALLAAEEFVAKHQRHQSTPFVDSENQLGEPGEID